MRLSPNPIPINRDSFGTVQFVRTIDERVPFWNCAAPFALAAAATLTIWVRDPLAEWAYEFAACVLAAIGCFRGRIRRPAVEDCAMAAIALWGFGQLLSGTTVYRYATWNAAARCSAFAATAFIAPQRRAANAFLKAFVWFGFLLSVVAVLAYYTSPGKVLWIFPTEYPDAWGPFLNRDNFAQFLELAVPAALWLATARGNIYMYFAAAMVAAGFASASRAGAAMLLAECVAAFILLPGIRRRIGRFAAAAVLLIAISGAGQLLSRLHEPDPLRYRREMASSAVAMIRAQLNGFGLGTFASVYPRYALFDAGLTVEHAHDDWLEWAAEGGIGFAAVWAVLAAAALARIRKQAWALGVLAVLIHAVVDYPFARFGVAAWTFLLIGMREVGGEAH